MVDCCLEAFATLFNIHSSDIKSFDFCGQYLTFHLAFIKIPLASPMQSNRKSINFGLNLKGVHICGPFLIVFLVKQNLHHQVIVGKKQTGFTGYKMMLQLVYFISQENMCITSTNKFLDNTRQACHLFCIKLLSSLSEVYFVNI